MISIDIDTGGTMTDALVTDGDTRHCIKVDTTPHDFTVSFQTCLEEAAAIYGHPSVEMLLRDVEFVRWSSTITTNALAERRGSKVGLIVSEGHEEDLYGDARSICVDEIVASENVIGLEPDADAGAVLAAVKVMLEGGARRICVSLKGAFPDNHQERAMKAIIEDQYPDHIIGSIPVLLGSEMAPITHDQTRAHYSLMNAYTHTRLATSLFKAEDMLRDDHRWSGALLIGHTNGGVARVGKTKAVDTIESGPVFGTFGGAYMARVYGLDRVACFDVGGTTTKSSVVRDGQPVFQRGGDLMEIPVQTSFAMLRSAAIGGGSVARLRGDHIVLGPDSMGAAPGPACYALGGQEPTITDALLVLGYLDPSQFLGGRRVLNLEKSREAIDRAIGIPLGISPEHAAIMIRDEAVAVMADLVSSILKEAGTEVAGTSLFSFGGNGPMFGAFVAERLGLDRVYAFDLGPVFSAFGSAQSDVVHVYERGIGKLLADEETLLAAQDLYDQAVRDLNGEGFDAGLAEIRYEFELDGDGIPCEFAYKGFPNQSWLTLAQDAAGRGKDRQVILLRLLSRFVVGAEELRPREKRGVSAKPTTKSIIFDGSAQQLPAYRWEDLDIGDSVTGPAILNGATLTCPVPPGWTLVVDQFGNAVISKLFNQEGKRR